MKKELLLLSLTSIMFFSSCASNSVEMQESGSKETIANDVSTFSTATTELSLASYHDSYVSFLYDSSALVCDPSEAGANSIITITCPAMDTVSEDVHNTVMLFITISNTVPLADATEDTVPTVLNTLSEDICTSLFTLNDDEYITNQSSKYSNFSSEYYMKISDGSKCYVKALNFNDKITMVVMRLCPYSDKYNSFFMNIYDTARSEYGNFDFSSAPEYVIASPDPVATQYPTFTPVPIESNSPSITVGQKNALKKANDYLRFSAFSYTGLISQLEYEGFTAEECTYAVDNCGADWNEQAAKKANDYLNISSFSRDSLISQLEYEGFTPEQAEYGVSQAGF